jgi:hypothetical protein
MGISFRYFNVANERKIYRAGIAQTIRLRDGRSKSRGLIPDTDS